MNNNNNNIGFILQAEKGMPGGVPTLNSLGIVDDIHLPSALLARNEAVATEAILIGQPVYLKQNGHLALASCIDNARSQMVGIALENGGIGYAIAYSSLGQITLTNWTIATSGANLVAGCDYFLDNRHGRITNIPPISGYLVYVGRAISSNTLIINLQPKIQL